MLVNIRKLLGRMRMLKETEEERIPARSLDMRNMKRPRSVRRANRSVLTTQSKTQKKRELYSLGCNN